MLNVIMVITSLTFTVKNCGYLLMNVHVDFGYLLMNVHADFGYLLMNVHVDFWDHLIKKQMEITQSMNICSSGYSKSFKSSLSQNLNIFLSIL